MIVQNNKHDKGIANRVKEIWQNETDRLIAVTNNVEYYNVCRHPFLTGELDILKLYVDGTIGIEEIKCSMSDQTYEKAYKQMKRAKEAFKNFNPEVSAYFIKEKYFTRF